MINIDVNVKNCKWNPSTCNCQCDKTRGIGVYLDINKCTCKEVIFDKLVLTCEDEIVDTSGTASIKFLDKMQYMKKLIVFFTIFY